MPNDSVKVGGAWKREYGDNKKYLSAQIDLDELAKARKGEVGGKVNVSIFPPRNAKTKDTQPDFDIVYSVKPRPIQEEESDPF